MTKPRGKVSSRVLRKALADGVHGSKGVVRTVAKKAEKRLLDKHPIKKKKKK